MGNLRRGAVDQHVPSRPDQPQGPGLTRGGLLSQALLETRTQPQMPQGAALQPLPAGPSPPLVQLGAPHARAFALQYAHHLRQLGPASLPELEGPTLAPPDLQNPQPVPLRLPAMLQDEIADRVPPKVEPLPQPVPPLRGGPQGARADRGLPQLQVAPRLLAQHRRGSRSALEPCGGFLWV